MSILLTMALAIADGSKEIMEKSKNILVSDEKTLKDELKKRDVNLLEVTSIDTGEKVNDWSKVRGVVKEGDQIFAFSDSIGSELNVNLSTF